jgi:hypothetical protein
MNDEVWAPLPLAEWQPTYATVHLWLQTVGKIRLAFTPLLNHWWNTTLYLSARGLTTSPMPFQDGAFEISFDFIDHRLLIDTSWGPRRELPLQAQSSADFHAAIMNELAGLGIDVKIWPMTVELPENIRLDLDREHHTYDAAFVTRWWRIMIAVESVMQEFRALFLGKSSPVHFFWGSFDLAVTRFNGRRAPYREGAGAMMNEAYSHEVISAGFWPGSGPIDGAAFYAYAAPAPEGLATAQVKPAQARYDTTLGEFVLMYEDVRNAPSPRQALFDFLQSTYDAAATLGDWNRSELERT